MTPAVETGFRPAEPGGHSIYHYRMAPGQAYLLDDDARTIDTVEISSGVARRATDTHTLRWVNGKTVAVFTLDGKTYAQPLPTGEPAKRPRLTKVKSRCESGDHTAGTPDIGPVRRVNGRLECESCAPEPEPPARKPRKRVGLL